MGSYKKLMNAVKFKAVILSAVVAVVLISAYVLQGLMMVAESYDQPAVQRIFLPIVRDAAQQNGIHSDRIRMPAGRVFGSCDFWTFEFLRVECGLIILYTKSTAETKSAALGLKGLTGC